ncbi:MAG: sensor domain-containing diguanylate cyclase [Myxococcales bacterium]|nr:sensor domain-containing diguanylate cyclase [Myxococcales bacterium]
MLLDLTRRLTDAKRLEDSLQDVTDAVLSLLSCDHASVRILDESGTQLLTGARSGLGTAQHPLAFRPGEGIAGWVVEHGRPVIVDDASKDSRFVNSPSQGFPIRSMVAAPLWSAGRVIGVLSASAAEPGRFSPEHVDLACLLANCAVPAIEKARLVRLSLTDDQTQAFNRRYEMPRLEEEISRSRRYGTPLTVLMLDLDHFKTVNDRFGHATGDRILEEFADRVRTVTRRHDVFIRRGGEEFVLIMPSTDTAEAKHVAGRIRDRIGGEPFLVDGGDEVTQTVSIGVATWTSGEDAFELEQRSDTALYRAKEAGRNRVCVAGETECV